MKKFILIISKGLLYLLGGLLILVGIVISLEKKSFLYGLATILFSSLIFPIVYSKIRSMIYKFNFKLPIICFILLYVIIVFAGCILSFRLLINEVNHKQEEKNIDKSYVIEYSAEEIEKLNKMKRYYNELVIVQDKAECEAEKKYPIDVDKSIFWVGGKYNRKLMEENLKKHSDLAKKLSKEYSKKVMDDFNFTKEDDLKIQNRAFKENWPLPKKQKCK